MPPSNPAMTQQESFALKEFTLFPKLAPELRRKIWNAACFDPRTFELERDGKDSFEIKLPPGGEPSVRIHRGIQVAMNSRYPVPVLFRVSHESRAEAKKVYQYIQFELSDADKAIVAGRTRASRNYLPSLVPRKSLWLNPYGDIVYFGQNCCLGTIISLLQTKVKIGRVAIDVGVDHYDSGMDTCCHLSLENLPCFDQFLGRSADHLIRQLRVLHGFELSGMNDSKKIFPGCSDLKEVFLFMKEAGPFDHEIHHFDKCVGFKTYTEESPYHALVGSHRVSMDAYSEHLVASALVPMGAKYWEGDKKPTFHLARRSKPIPSDQMFEMVALRIQGAGQLRMLWWKARQLHKQHCLCTLYPPQYSGPGDYIFKFMGRESAVDIGWKILAEEAEKVQALFKEEIVMVDAREAMFPTSKTSKTPRSEMIPDGKWNDLDDVF